MTDEPGTKALIKEIRRTYGAGFPGSPKWSRAWIAGTLLHLLDETLTERDAAYRRGWERGREDAAQEAKRYGTILESRETGALERRCVEGTAYALEHHIRALAPQQDDHHECTKP